MLSAQKEPKDFTQWLRTGGQPGGQTLVLPCAASVVTWRHLESKHYLAHLTEGQMFTEAKWLAQDHRNKIDLLRLQSGPSVLRTLLTFICLQAWPLGGYKPSQ